MKIDLIETRNYPESPTLENMIIDQYAKTPKAAGLAKSLFAKRNTDTHEPCPATATQLALMKAEISLFMPTGNCVQQQYF